MLSCTCLKKKTKKRHRGSEVLTSSSTACCLTHRFRPCVFLVAISATPMPVNEYVCTGLCAVYRLPSKSAERNKTPLSSRQCTPCPCDSGLHLHLPPPLSLVLGNNINRKTTFFTKLLWSAVLRFENSFSPLKLTSTKALSTWTFIDR